MSWFNPWRKQRMWRHCPHLNIRGIYGDEIHMAGGRRLRCQDCGNDLDGLLQLATE